MYNFKQIAKKVGTKSSQGISRPIRKNADHPLLAPWLVKNEKGVIIGLKEEGFLDYLKWRADQPTRSSSNHRSNKQKEIDLLNDEKKQLQAELTQERIEKLAAIKNLDQAQEIINQLQRELDWYKEHSSWITEWRKRLTFKG